MIGARDQEPAVYRSFLAASLAFASLGALCGAGLLWRLGDAGSLVAAGSLTVNALGQMQVMGFLVLLLMGAGYQLLPRMFGGFVSARGLIRLVWLAMVGSVLARSVAMALYAHEWAPAAHAAAGLVQIAAVSTFTAQMMRLLMGEIRSPAAGLLMLGLVFMLAQTALSVWHMDQLLRASERGVLLQQIATWQGPLRDAQLHGMALFLLLGMGMRLFPKLYGVTEYHAHRRGWLAVGALTLGLMLELGFFLAFRLTGQRSLAGGLLLSWVLLPFGCLLITMPWRFWRMWPMGTAPEPSAKFIRAGIAWLFVSLALLQVFPAYHLYAGFDFSHAYHGAIRQTMVGGFVLLLCVGLTCALVPRMLGVRPPGGSTIWGVFLLLNAACLIRVVTQIWTDFDACLFAWLPIAGTLQMAGVLWWVASMAALLRRGAGRAVDLGWMDANDGHRSV